MDYVRSEIIVYEDKNGLCPKRMHGMTGTMLRESLETMPLTVYTNGDYARFAKVTNYFTEMCSGSEAGSYLRPIDFCITQL